jgi:hypothetical protein
MYCNLYLCIAIYIYVLQCISMYCNVYLRIAIYIYVLQSISTYCNLYLRIAMYIYVLQCISMYCNVYLCIAIYIYVLQSISMYCNVYLCIAIYIYVLQSISMYCNLYLCIASVYLSVYLCVSINYGKGTWDSALRIRAANHLEDPGADGRIILKPIFKKWNGWAWTGLIWFFRIGTGVGLLWMRWWTVGFHKMRGTAWLAVDLSASQEGLCSMKSVS